MLKRHDLCSFIGKNVKLYFERSISLLNMQSFSIVIICKNEADVIAGTLQSIQGLTDDIVVYDNGSNDKTIEIVKQFNVQLHQGDWEGYAKTKKKAIELAKYDWIFSLDADESIDVELKQFLLALELKNEKEVYKLVFKNFLGNKYLKYGEWGGDKHIRLFNRKKVTWNDSAIHEQLILPKDIEVKKAKGYVLHQTAKDINEYASKVFKYAMLNAENYYQQGKRSSWFWICISPGFNFFNYYVLRLGFLDGHAGYVCAKMTAWYTFLKYSRLKELYKINARQ